MAQATSTADHEALVLAESVLHDLATSGRSDRIADLSQALDGDLSAAARARVANVLSYHHFQNRDYEPALAACMRWIEAAPDEINARHSRLSILALMRRFDEVIEIGTRQLAEDPDDFRVHASLNIAFGRLGRLDEARSHGTACLELKDRSAQGEPLDLGAVPVPPFDPGARSRNIIAFSLFGAKRSYIEGAIENIVAARYLYPEWTCRFYVDDSVPAGARKQLFKEGAQVKNVQGLPAARFGTFWRFLVADDADLDRYIVRDCDACLNLRERAAVEEWIDSGRHFHVMRDAVVHCELMLAGMWGGVRGALPPMAEAIVRFAQAAPLARTADQNFLREHVWPTVRTSVLVHDSQFAFGERADFPSNGRLPPGQTVGQAVVRRPSPRKPGPSPRKPGPKPSVYARRVRPKNGPARPPASG